MTKQALFDILPSRLLYWYFDKRNFVQKIKTEVIPGVFMNILLNKDNELWISRLEKVNGHEPEICQFFNANLNNAEIIYDVGSHFGYFPAFLSSLDKDLNIHCFQPSMHMFNFLRLNQFFYKKKNKWKVTRKFVSNINDTQNVSLDAYVKSTGQWPNLIKIDIDGPEVSALKGCEKIIAERKTRFLVEIHPKAMKEMFDESWDDIFELIPSDYIIKYLPNVRGSSRWSDSFDSVRDDPNPYIYFCPNELNTDHFD